MHELYREKECLETKQTHWIHIVTSLLEDNGDCLHTVYVGPIFLLFVGYLLLWDSLPKPKGNKGNLAVSRVL